MLASVSPEECIFITWWWEYTFACSKTPSMSFSLLQTYYRLFMYRKAQLNSIFFNSHYSDLHHLSIPLTLCHYISGVLLLCCQSVLCGFSLTLRYSTLTSTKAGTVCQPEAPCRPTAPEVRNKENITVCAALKKTSRSTIQAAD